MLKVFLLFVLSLSNVYALNCGDTITTKVRLTEDLDCSEYTGYAALIIKENGILQGNDFSIIAPNTSAVIYAEGGDIRVRRTNIIGSENNIGVMGYNVQKLVVNNSNIDGAYIGVDYYTEDSYACDRLRVSNSHVRNNEYAVRVNAPNCDYVPRFVNNDFSNSKSFALNITSKRIRLVEKQNNIFDGSSNGLLLKSDELIRIKDLDLSNAQIAGSLIYVYSSAKLVVDGAKLANGYEGIHAYDVADVRIRNVLAENMQTGIKVVNESVTTSLKVRNTETNGNNIGLLIAKYGNAEFSEVKLINNMINDYLANNS
tara:strand:- start:5691 stop:6632 length:942 start_codon:yes stop_codon:yes gene_type:complete